MSDAPDGFCVNSNINVPFEGNDVQAVHVHVPNPRPRQMNKECVAEDYYIFEENGQIVLAQVSSRCPYILSRVDPKTSEGQDTWTYVSRLGPDVAGLLKS